MGGVTDPAEAYFKDGSWGFDGSVWRKLALVWGFSGAYLERETDDVEGIGTRLLQFSQCPLGSVRVVTGFCAYNATTAPSRTTLRVREGADSYVLKIQLAPGVYETVNLGQPVILVNPQYLDCAFSSCADGDTIAATAWGYEMALTN